MATSYLTPEQQRNEDVAQAIRFGKQPPAAEPTVADTYKDVKVPGIDQAYETAASEVGNYYQQQATQPIDERKIYRDTLSQYQAQIDATNKIYQQQLREAQVAGQGRLGSQTAMSARSGTLGSDFGAAQEQKVRGYNADIEGGIRAEQAAKIGEIMGLARKGAADELAAKRKAKMEGAESYLKYLGSKSERRQSGIANIANALVQQGVSPDQVDPKVLTQLASQIGATPEDILASYYDAKKSNDAETAQTDLATRKTEAEIKKIDADIAKGKLLEIGEGTMLYNVETGETFKNPKTYAPTGGSVQPGDNPQLYSGLTSGTATAVRSMVGKFGSEPVVQNFSTIQEGRNFAKGISDTTQNPADDQALIYSLAKSLDPGSVVREGEYATAQKYAQSWIAAYGKGVEQALAGTGFLSEDARKNIKKVIEQKYVASENSYKNLQKNYEGRINNLTGRSDGGKFLVDYSAPMVDSTAPADGLSEEEAYQQYLNTINGAQ